MSGAAMPDELDGSYWARTNTAADVWAELNAVGVLLGGATNGEDIVAVDTGHVFVARTPETFAYDADGNLTQGARFRYEWDAENRMTLVETRTNLQSTTPRVRLTFVYDHQGRRVQKIVESGYSGVTYATTNMTAFVWDGFNIIAEICDAGYTNWYTYGLDLSGTLQGAGGVGGALVMTRDTDTATNTYLYCFDGHRNVVNLADASDDSIAASYDYAPFGSLIRSTGTMAADNPVRWSTKHTDDETGLVMYELRAYNPVLGRWLSRDPIGEEGGIHLYGFVENNPTGYLDGLGLACCCKSIWVDFRPGGIRFELGVISDPVTIRVGSDITWGAIVEGDTGKSAGYWCC